MNEKDLLRGLIEEGVLGKGKADFEVNVGLKTPNYIDLVYETNDEIWLIEAKINLDYKALGQILFYKDLYLYKFTTSKPISLGVVCLKVSGDEIIDFYERNGIKIFILKEVEEEEEKKGANPICSVCGKSMTKNENNEWICKICHYFFGISSKPVKCERCGQIYGTFPAIESKTNGAIGYDFLRDEWKEGLCPKCRRDRGMERFTHNGAPYVTPYDTVANSIKHEMKRRTLTKNDLIWRGIPEEFIEFCLGRKEINL